MAVDALADHFSKFTTVEGPLPVLWHQALLALAQRYKADLTSEQKDRLKQLMHVHSHHAITPEIRRELFSAGCRGDPRSMALPITAAGGASSAAAAAAAGTAKPAAKAKPVAAPVRGGKRQSGDALDDVAMY